MRGRWQDDLRVCFALSPSTCNTEVGAAAAGLVGVGIQVTTNLLLVTVDAGIHPTRRRRHIGANGHGTVVPRGATLI